MASIAGHLSSSHHVMELIARKEWELARLEIQRDPVMGRKCATVRGFLGSDMDCQVTPMHQACSSCSHHDDDDEAPPPVDFIEVLHALDPRFVDTRDSVYKRLPLHVALIASARTEVIFKLIELDPATAQGQDILGRYPLHYACHHGAELPVVERLVSAYPFAATRADSNGWLPLHVACRFDMPLAVIRLLLKIYPFSIHVKTSKGTTPLSYARRTKTPELIEFLESVSQSTCSHHDRRQHEQQQQQQQQQSREQNDGVDRSLADPAVHQSSSVGLLMLNTITVLPTPRFFDLEGGETSAVVAEVVRRRSFNIGSASSVASSLTNSPTLSSSSGTARRRKIPEFFDKDELTRLAIIPISPYNDSNNNKSNNKNNQTRKIYLPFLSEKLGLENMERYKPI